MPCSGRWSWRGQAVSPAFRSAEVETAYSLVVWPVGAVVPKLKQGRYVVQLGTAASPGHYTMTLPDLWAQHVGEFMQWLGDTPPRASKSGARLHQ